MNAHNEDAGPVSYDVIVIGAGFSGLYLLHRLRSLGLKVRVFERGAGVGGTWYWNRYPGARCDVESLQYSYTFSEDLLRDWRWSERYGAQPEILRYIDHVADRFNLRPDIQLNTDVKSCVFDEAAGIWSVTTSDGKTVATRFVMLATGMLSATNVPQIPGLEAFEGPVYHTGAWPHEPVDFAGRRVGVIGTGSSGMQLIPHLAEQANQLLVFQRTPNYSIPARNRPLSDEEHDAYLASVKAEGASFREKVVTSSYRATFEDTTEARRAFYEAYWLRGGASIVRLYNDTLTNRAANEDVADFLRLKIRDIVDYPFLTKRIVVDVDYFETFNRPNVTLVDIHADPIREIAADGLQTEGHRFEFDTLVMATGFDAGTGSVAKIDIRGRDGQSLKDKWKDGPKNYLGLMIAGFPNLFTVAGVGSHLANAMIAIEMHVDWIAKCLIEMRHSGAYLIEAEADAEARWMGHCNELVQGTFTMETDSWWNGANVPGKARIFLMYPGSIGGYRKACENSALNNYEGFRMSILKEAPFQTSLHRNRG
jgi:cyclohexanone monooxygenase